MAIGAIDLLLPLQLTDPLFELFVLIDKLAVLIDQSKNHRSDLIRKRIEKILCQFEESIHDLG
jgi:hypothetical protein